MGGHELRTLTVVSTAVTPFHLTITFTIEGGQPAIGSGDVTLVYSVTTPEIDTVYTYWARRNDFAAGDFVSSGNAGLVTVADSRYVIRRDPYWVEGDRRNRIRPDSPRGVGVRRNSDHLEPLSRRIGPSAVSASRWCSVRDDERKCSLCGRGADPANQRTWRDVRGRSGLGRASGVETVRNRSTRPRRA